MARVRNVQEVEFELALTGTLEDIYDLLVRSERDTLNRRKNGYATLDFAYEYRGDESDDVKVAVSLRDLPDVSFTLRADFSSPDAIAESAEDCEELALAVRAHLAQLRSRSGGSSRGRRWDD